MLASKLSDESKRGTTSSGKAHPYSSASVVSRYFFWWLLDVLRTGLRRQIVPGDIYDTPPSLRSSPTGEMLRKCWSQEKLGKRISPNQTDSEGTESSHGIGTEQRHKRPPPPWRLLRTLLRIHGTGVIAFGFFYSSIESACRIGQPFLLGQLILYFDQQRSTQTAGSTTSLGEAYGYAIGIVITVFAPLAIFHSYQLFLLKVGMKIRIGCSGLIYRKILRLPNTTEGLSGTVINLMTNDVSRFDYAVIFFHDLWKGPVELAIVAVLVYLEIGGAGLIGIGFLLLFIPVQAWLGKRSARVRLATALATDERVRFTNEILSGIQVIKMYVWERSFQQIVRKLRQKEIKAVRGSAIIKSALFALRIVPKVSIFLTLVSYVYFGNALTARRVYMLISFFSVIHHSMVEFWPLAVTSAAEGWISLIRIQEFLLQDVLPMEENPEDTNTKPVPMIEPGGATRFAAAIEFVNVHTTWPDSTFSLQDISFAANIATSRTLAVVGSIGAGKSSLLNLITGEQRATQGKIKVRGTVSYCSQKPWMFEGTVRENVLFIEPYEEERYRRVLKVCALEQDIRLWGRGDETMVGERGVSLSGGQKARINLARSLYRKADIYLLDDPLSAVDAHVAKVIFEEGIQSFLDDKLCLLVTHQLKFLSSVEHILIMESGKIVAQGSYMDVIDYFQGTHFNNQAQSSEFGGIIDEDRTDSATDVQLVQVTAAEERSMESQDDGAIQLKVYLDFLKYVKSVPFVLLVATLMAASQVASTGTDYFVFIWVDWEETYANTVYARWTTFDHVMCYTAAIVITIVMTINSFTFFEMCLKASLHIYSALYRGVSETSMHFFNTNTSGRIMNRFSKDIGLIDSSLPVVMIDSSYFFLELFGIIAIVSLANYWLLVPTVLMACLFYLLRFIFLRTARNVKRVEAITRSPMFTHTNTTIEGLPTIRSFGAERYLEDSFHQLQDRNTSAAFLFGATTRAFAFWLDVICLLYITSVVLSFLIIGNDIISGNVGLAITQVLNLVGMCNWGIRQTAELENQMTSVERVLEYARLEPEPNCAPGAPVVVPGDTWPKNPSITFREVSLRYASTANFVLKRLSFDIKPKERVGIVGRTGAGKSSIIQALFRLTPISSGELGGREGIIEIDGINIDSVPLRQCRSRISIIPQDPVIFSGSLRSNLDPYDRLPDERLWKALEQVELLSTVSALAGGLSTRMAEGGTNFSTGQKQLLCLARAMLKDSNILIMDEATASVDPKTDQLIQRTIREHCRNCTVLTIAHRLHTIMDNDRILVMDAGQVVEFDTPERLLLIPDGFFRKLFDENNYEKRSAYQ